MLRIWTTAFLIEWRQTVQTLLPKHWSSDICWCSDEQLHLDLYHQCEKKLKYIKALYKCIYLQNIITEQTRAFTNSSDFSEVKTAVNKCEYFTTCWTRLCWVQCCDITDLMSLIWLWLWDLYYERRLMLLADGLMTRRSFLSRCLNKQWKMSKCLFLWVFLSVYLKCDYYCYLRTFTSSGGRFNFWHGRRSVLVVPKCVSLSDYNVLLL